MTGSNSRARTNRSGAQLTDDDLTKISGKREQVEGVLQQRYGYAKDKAKAEIEKWANDLK